MTTDPSSLPPTLPKNHLDHPENWVTGSEPITANQEGFIKTLEKQKPELVPADGLDTASMTKSEGSEVIDKLKKGEKVAESAEDDANPTEKEATSAENKSASAVAETTKGDTAPTDTKPTETNGSSSPSSKRKAADHDGKVESSNGSSSHPPADQTNGTASDTNVEDSTPTDTVPPTKKAKLENGNSDLPSEEKEAEVKDYQNGEVKEGKAQEEGKAEKTGGGETIPGDTAAEAIVVDTDSVTNGKTNGHATNGHSKDETASAQPEHLNGTNGNTDGAETQPGDAEHLAHPENWATGDQPATEKQKAFVKVLERQKGAPGATGDVDSLGKSEASEKIEELKSM